MKTQATSFLVHKVRVKRQRGSSDCGLFAIAFAYSICEGRDPHSICYDQSVMRNTLQECSRPVTSLASQK